MKGKEKGRVALIAHRRQFLIAPLNQLPLTDSISPSFFLGLPGKAIYLFSPFTLSSSYPADEFNLFILFRGIRRCIKKEAEVLHFT